MQKADEGKMSEKDRHTAKDQAFKPKDYGKEEQT